MVKKKFSRRTNATTFCLCALFDKPIRLRASVRKTNQNSCFCSPVVSVLFAVFISWTYENHFNVVGVDLCWFWSVLVWCCVGVVGCCVGVVGCWCGVVLVLVWCRVGVVSVGLVLCWCGQCWFGVVVVLCWCGRCWFGVVLVWSGVGVVLWCVGVGLVLCWYGRCWFGVVWVRVGLVALAQAFFKPVSQSCAVAKSEKFLAHH